jgi:glycosyltransferase involved in cell wall biosynthesis
MERAQGGSLELKILLLITDLFQEIGGGQTVYKKIVKSSPDIEFHYFRVRESEMASRPTNSRALPLLGSENLRLRTPPPHQRHFVDALQRADRFARSVAGRSYDIVELPDFFDFGGFIKEAFAHHNVRVGRFVLSLHGNISNSIDLNWGSAGDKVLEVQQLEQLQFDAADGAYGISPRYISTWQSRYDRPVYFVDPAHFVVASSPARLPSKHEVRPSLYCVGRSERLKGNDLFVELVRWINPLLFERAEHIGGVDMNGGYPSDLRLAEIARKREVAVAHRSAMSHEELCEVFARASALVLPVRYDSLNLVALEALFNGCPLVISKMAGACDYLDQYHPHLPYEKIDFENFYGAVEQIELLLTSYDERRKDLHSKLQKHVPWPPRPLDMMSIYSAILDVPPRKPVAFHGPIRIWAGFSYEEDQGDRGSTAADEHLRALETEISDAGISVNGAFPGLMNDIDGLISRLKAAGEQSERNRDAVKDKLRFLYQAASNPILRCNFWLEIARVERLLGNPIIAAAYELRALRLVGEDRWGIMPRLTETLRETGNGNEADAAEALYGPKASADAVHTLLRQRLEELKTYKAKSLAICDDRRDAKPPKVAVIVSLYNAADKLELFLTMLCRQTLLRMGEVEVILVDSGSPSDERSVFEAFHRKTPFSALYARSAKRETIQAAWNRGIKLARAPYLVFLGADETIFPEALAVLAQELDTHPEADWVMSNSLVTEVDVSGLHKNDVMTYDRAGAGKDHVILDTCYVSWVGGMYRASIHERFGYYDEKFRGAGDTEFKNRILPHIRVRFVDRMLGMFLNYPDGQTTASPMAEIEDSRAWYLFRTPGGVRYLFENRPVEDAEDLLLLCLGYRKSYCRHLSSDIELAVPLARHIISRKPHSSLAQLVLADLETIQQNLQNLEFSSTMLENQGLRMAMLQAWLHASLAQERHRIGIETLGRDGRPTYGLMNDNRFEQHSWLWKSVGRDR